jgi:hypothetical protein
MHTLVGKGYKFEMIDLVHDLQPIKANSKSTTVALYFCHKFVRNTCLQVFKGNQNLIYSVSAGCN